MSSSRDNPNASASGAPAAPPEIPPHLRGASLWRREPYRVLFPTGLALAWAGVLHWLLHGLGVLPDYRPVFHSITQIQGFMMCFAVGFLFTAIPRRTGTAPPAAWQVILVAAAPVGTTLAAWWNRLALSQLLWAVQVAVVIVFAVARFRSSTAARRRSRRVARCSAASPRATPRASSTPSAVGARVSGAK